MKKYIFILLLTLLPIFSVTNIAIKLEEGSSIMVEKGNIFTAPYTGWFFNKEYTIKAMTAIEDVGSLQKELFKLKLKSELQQDKIDWYLLQQDFFKTVVDISEKERQKRDFMSIGLTIGGFVVGVGVTVIGFFVIGKSYQVIIK